MNLKSILYREEQEEIIEKIIDILQLDENYSITLYDLDNDNEKQSKISSYTKLKNASHQKKMDRIKHSKIRKMNDKFYTKHRLTLKNQGK